MSPEAEILAVIDVGTTKVCTVVGRKAGTRGVTILGYSTVPCNGLRKGNVADIALTESAVRESLLEVAAATGYRIESAFVGVTGHHVGFENRRDRLDSAGEVGAITTSDLNRVPEPVMASSNEPGRSLIHTIRMSYSLDGAEAIRNPVGMHSSEVEVKTHVVTGGTVFIDRLVKAVEGASVKVNSLVLEPLASGLAVLTPQEKETGVVMVDIGGGTTDLVGFKRGRVCYTGVIPVGGFQFTNDIALAYDTPYDAAEAAKVRYATADPYDVEADEEISLPVAGQDGEVRIHRQELCQLTRERAQELAQLVKLKLEEAQMGEPSELRLVLTGGASNLRGLTKLMQRNLGIPVRRGLPSIRGTIPDELQGPAYATSVGMLLWAINEHVPATSSTQNGRNHSNEGGPNGFLSALFGRLSNLMPFSFFEVRKGRI